MSETELQELRASLIQLAKALETERACVLRIVRLVEKQATPISAEPATIQGENNIYFVKSVV